MYAYSLNFNSAVHTNALKVNKYLHFWLRWIQHSSQMTYWLWKCYGAFCHLWSLTALVTIHFTILQTLAVAWKKECHTSLEWHEGKLWKNFVFWWTNFWSQVCKFVQKNLLTTNKNKPSGTTEHCNKYGHDTVGLVSGGRIHSLGATAWKDRSPRVL